MKRKKDVSRSGETLVEIMVSAVVFLILVGILQGAIVFCSNAQRRSEQLRETNSQICQSLREAAYIPGSESAELVFKAVSHDGSLEGTEILFAVNVDLGTIEAQYTDEAGASWTIDFYVFGSDPAQGGGTP